MIGFWGVMTQFQEQVGRVAAIDDPETQIVFMREDCQALFMEVAELTDSFQWKPWREGEVIDRENVKREIVDCLFFLHHIAVNAGITSKELDSKFTEVMANNRRRYIDGDFSGEEDTPILSDL